MGDVMAFKEKISMVRQYLLNLNLLVRKLGTISQAGKMVLVKLNQACNPLFTKHGIKIPNLIVKQIDIVNRLFFQNNNVDYDNGQGSIISSNKVCRPKCEAGLQIRKLQDVNAKLLAKLSWKLLTDPENIWIKVVSAEYLGRLIFSRQRKLIRFLKFGNTF